MAITNRVLDSWMRAGAPLYERHGRHLPVLAAALFALLLGRAAADLVWTLVPVPESARWQPPPAERAVARSADSPEAAAVASVGLFGRYDAPAAGAESLLAAPDTPLNLKLIGLLADDRERYSRALIYNGTDEQSYAIGDDVTRGVMLQAIFPDRVILSRNGRLETLRLDRDTASAGGGDFAAPAVALLDERPAPSASGSPTLARIRDEVLRDPARASEFIRIQPANVAGQLKGYRVYPGRDRSAFSAAGLRPGDLVTSVNGVQLDDPAKALQMLGDMGQAGVVNLVVERGGQAQAISINLTQ
ncbi:MAG: type II secretion system protein GspC [Gammaproteobacteria bacterium]